jgi:hypothetical protein
MSIENEFNSEMEQIYQRARNECNYDASDFYEIVTTQGGLAAAKQLITQDTSGFKKLCELNRLDLTIESHVIKEKYASLFTDAEKEMCYERLKKARYTIRNFKKKTVYPLSGKGKAISYYEQNKVIRVIWGDHSFELYDDQIKDLLTNFFTDENAWYQLGASMTDSPQGSFGKYIDDKYPSLTPHHASAIASIMVNEGLLTYRGKKPIELQKCHLN